MPAGICSQRETHYSVSGKTHKRYFVAEEFGELLQLREAFGKAMVVLMVDDELKAEGRRGGGRPQRRNLIAVNGGENLAERLELVGVKTQPEGTGWLYSSYQLVALRGVQPPLYLPCCLSSWFLWEKGRTKARFLRSKNGKSERRSEKGTTKGSSCSSLPQATIKTQSHTPSTLPSHP
jgi:hypothetical protein